MNFFGKTSYKISLRLAILTCKSVFNQIATKQKATLYNILFFVRLSSIVECSHLKMQVSDVTLLHPPPPAASLLPPQLSRAELLCFMKQLLPCFPFLFFDLHILDLASLDYGMDVYIKCMQMYMFKIINLLKQNLENDFISIYSFIYSPDFTNHDRIVTQIR